MNLLYNVIYILQYRLNPERVRLKNLPILLCIAEPFFGIPVTMRTSGPTARSALAFGQIFAHALDVLRSGFLFFDDGDPANPFVTRKRREAVPLFQNVVIGRKRFSHVRGNVVTHAGGDLLSTQKKE